MGSYPRQPLQRGGLEKLKSIKRPGKSDGRVRRLLIVVLVAGVLAGGTLAAYLSFVDLEPPEIVKIDYIENLRSGEAQKITVTVRERNPAEFSTLELNGTSVRIPLAMRFGNGTALYRVSFNPSTISPSEGKLAGKLIVVDKLGNKAEGRVAFNANLREPMIEGLKVARVRAGVYYVCVEVLDENLDKVYIELENGNKTELNYYNGKHCGNISTKFDSNIIIYAEDKYGLTSYLHTKIEKQNPSLNYALQKGLDKSLIEYITHFDEDDEMDEKESELIDYITYIGEKLIPLELKNYWKRGEIISLQKKLFQSVLEDGVVSSEELNSLKKILSWDRWNIAKDIINSGMINDNALKEDWDGDGISNLMEIMAGTNPLNELEIHPLNRSEVYIINISGPGWGDPKDYSSFANTLIIYHIQRRLGIPEENIYILADNRIFLNEENFIYAPTKIIAKNLQVYRDWNGKDLISDFPLPRFYKLGEISKEDLSRIILELKDLIDENDILVINIYGHMSKFDSNSHKESGGYLWGGFKPPVLISNYEVSQLLSSLKYGRAVIFVSGCQSEAFASNIDKLPFGRLNPLNNTVAIASAPFDKYGSSGWIMWVWEYLSQGLTIKDVGEKIIDPLGNLYYLVYCFDRENSDTPKCPWIETFNPVVYIPKK